MVDDDDRVRARRLYQVVFAGLKGPRIRENSGLRQPDGHRYAAGKPGAQAAPSKPAPELSPHQRKACGGRVPVSEVHRDWCRGVHKALLDRHTLRGMIRHHVVSPDEGNSRRQAMDSRYDRRTSISWTDNVRRRPSNLQDCFATRVYRSHGQGCAQSSSRTSMSSSSSPLLTRQKPWSFSQLSIRSLSASRS